MTLFITVCCGTQWITQESSQDMLLKAVSNHYAPWWSVIRIQSSHCRSPGFLPGQGSLSSSSPPATYQPPQCNRITPWASPVAQMVKNLPAMQETQVRSLGQEDPLEKEMATHFNIFAWRIPGTEEPGGLQSMGSQRIRPG